jgi:hypothetical protein
MLLCLYFRGSEPPWVLGLVGGPFDATRPHIIGRAVLRCCPLVHVKFCIFGGRWLLSLCCSGRSSSFIRHLFGQWHLSIHLSNGNVFSVSLIPNEVCLSVFVQILWSAGYFHVSFCHLALSFV